MPAPSHAAWSTRAGVAWISVAVSLVLMLWLGQDANWDMLNYHLYDPHAWWHGRMASDIAPAQKQTWHNPFLDLPLYGMVRAGWPGWAVGLWLTAPFAAALWLLLRLYQRLAPEPAGLGILVTLAALASTGAAAISALGTSMDDGFVAAAVLAAIYLVMRHDAPRRRDWLLAGAAAGAITGLKLTAAPYCLGLAAMALVGAPLRTAPARLIPLVVGGIAGFLLSYGYWGWVLFDLHGNPFFPYFNQYFRSPDALFSSYSPLSRIRWDDPFAAVREIVSMPFRLLRENVSYSEARIRDPRLLLGSMAAVVLCWRGSDRDDTTARWRRLAAFFFASLLAWVAEFGIYRYIVPAEMIASLLLVAALQRLPGKFGAGALAIATAAILVFTIRPDWGHAPFRSPMLSLSFPALPERSLVVTSSQEPLSYALLALSDDVPVIAAYNTFVSPDQCTATQARIERTLASHDGPLWLLRHEYGDRPGMDILRRHYGLQADPHCLPVESSLERLFLCRLQRVAPANRCWPDGH